MKQIAYGVFTWVFLQVRRKMEGLFAWVFLQLESENYQDRKLMKLIRKVF